MPNNKIVVTLKANKVKDICGRRMSHCIGSTSHSSFIGIKLHVLNNTLGESYNMLYLSFDFPVVGNFALSQS